MAKTLKDLLLALLNATLILVALCLFLGWQLASKVESITAEFSETVQVVAPLREETTNIRTELAALRDDLAALPKKAIGLDSQTTKDIQSTLARLNSLEQKLQTAQDRLISLADEPQVLIAQTINSGADVVSKRILDFKGCEPGS
ncbi:MULTISPECIES: hypothetical protein [unclassified Ruegeria]|uniref:hypothetical protein n=1 Tax=unclassified Ruegeria TaxID=2625375 RepID=UPI00148985B7|nr:MULTISPECIES: hypothetical protein [unclassified Ruegeria]NOD34184.1 hypothetical protein [Ruegeria sp. HKCCD7296]NOD46584.1 hypothetical protein [Ruegeria sp. HKCCD5849]NOD50116.1 hypothetical protein [Ruegeria sp. HKCCD5851]NOD66951.1 hypothetical protein [Ruegeria sp. HKCCD7303]NOE32539.1 hypothetical protein [Ruegeria sp. HKCCD7318]